MLNLERRTRAHLEGLSDGVFEAWIRDNEDVTEAVPYGLFIHFHGGDYRLRNRQPGIDSKHAAKARSHLADFE